MKGTFCSEKKKILGKRKNILILTLRNILDDFTKTFMEGVINAVFFFFGGAGGVGGGGDNLIILFMRLLSFEYQIYSKFIAMCKCFFLRLKHIISRRHKKGRCDRVYEGELSTKLWISRFCTSIYSRIFWSKCMGKFSWSIWSKVCLLFC